MSTIGERLKLERENKNFDLEEIHSALKISSHIIKAIEENKAEELIDPVYVKNFIKKYAQFLELDGESISKEYFKQYKKEEEKQDQQQPTQTEEKPAPKNIKPVLKYIVIAIIIIGLLWMLIKSATVLVIKIKDKITAGQKAVSSETAKRSSIFPIPENQPLNLTLETNDKVWVKIKADGQIITQVVLDTESSELWQAKEEFEITVGRPEAVKLTLNGKALNLPKDKRINAVIINHNGLHF
jgi:cytoskeletal protein RodZ